MRAIAKTKGTSGAVCEIDAPRPPVNAGQVSVRVTAAGVCGTDVHFYEWPEYMAREYAPDFPVIMGHEFTGTVDRVGAGVTDIVPGVQVVVNPHLYCGKCHFCFSGRPVLCDDRPILGCNRDGGWAEWVSVPRESVHLLPADVEPAIGALSEPLSVAVHSVVERAPCEPGDVVLILGPGPVGLLHLLVARFVGARHVIVIGVASDRERLRLAAKLGAITVNASEGDALTAVRRIKPGGADVAYETSGHPDALHLAVEATRKGGRIALIGFADHATPVDTLQLVVKEKELVGVRAYNTNTWLKTMAIISELAPDLKQLISHTLPFSAIEEAFGLIKRRECMKVLVEPGS